MPHFAKFDGVDGESTDANHDKWIDVLSTDWGMDKPGGAALNVPVAPVLRAPGN